MNDFAAGLGWVVMVAGGVGVAACLFALSLDYAWKQVKKARGFMNIWDAFEALDEKRARSPAETKDAS